MTTNQLTQGAADVAAPTSSLSQAIERYLLARPNWGSRTLKFHRNVLKSYARQGDWPPTAAGVNAYLADCRQRGVSQVSLKTYRAAMGGFLRWLVQLDLVAPATLRAIEPITPKAPSPRKGTAARAFGPLGEVIDRFLLAKSSRSPHTIAHLRTALVAFCRHSGGAWPPTADSINEFLADCKSRGLKKRTLVTYRMDLTGFLRWLIDRDQIEPAILKHIEKQFNPRGVPRGVKKDHLRKMIGELNKGEDWREVRECAAFSLLLDTAMRIGELTGLTLDRLDMAERSILLTDTKSGLDRFVYFTEDAAQRLTAWLEIRAAMRVDSEHVFVSSYRANWKRVSNGALRYSLHVWQRRAGVPQFRVHDLRHTAAINLLHNGMTLDRIGNLLGHTKLATTALYLRCENPDLREHHERFSPLANLGEG